MNEPVLTGEQAPINVAGSPVRLTSALAQYAHVANCLICRTYAEAYVDLADEWTVVAATLSHHDSGHLHDILLTASQHFGTYPG